MRPKEKIAQAHGRDPLWYKDAVIYELHVRAFFDSNGDGVGDFEGLTAKLEYLRDLGVNTLWVLPFYPSPMRDDGYDIADYRDIHSEYGTRKDFSQFIRAAHEHGLRVITELVINHTSDQHPWFQAARRAPKGSSKRDFYVWSDTAKKFADTRIIFTDTEKSNWTWDEVAKSYYWHRFFSHQPDLNHNNPQVVKAVIRIMQFWFDQGVDGLRLDAIPYLCVRDGTINENLPETHAVIRHMRSVMDARYADRMLLAEANQWPEDVRDYFGAGDECHMAYHFPLMPRMYMAIAQEDRHPVVEIMKQTPDIPPNCQWAIFLRNHDELTLEMVTNKERDYMYKMYAADIKARINLGIRRRLAPLMDNDFDKVRLMNSLLLSMPGSPIIYYGDEIGMGDNIYLGDRNGVRTPMQWSPDRNAGFSRADPQRLFLPPIMDPVYGFEAVNVEAQARDPSSLLNWTRRMLSIRSSSQAFGRGELHFLEPGNRKVLAYLRRYEGETILCVANLARSAQPVELDLGAYKGDVPVELMGRTPFPPIGDLPYLLTLHGHGFYWFRLTRGAEMPVWYDERLAPDELPMLVLFDGWRSLFRDRVVPWRIAMADKVRTQFEDEALPRFLEKQRWYSGKSRRLHHVALVDYAEWDLGRDEWFLTIMRIGDAVEDEVSYFLPLALVWEDDTDARTRALPTAIARVRRQANLGLLGDALADPEFCQAMVVAAGVDRTLNAQAGTVCWRAASDDARGLITAAAGLAVHQPNPLSSNTTVGIGDKLFLKCYRRLQPGINPEREIGQYLTDVAHFAHVVPILATMEYIGADGGETTLAILQKYVENQGDGWTYTVNYLEKFLDLAPTMASATGDAVHGTYAELMRMLGCRTGELHTSLALRTGNDAFDPEVIAPDDVSQWLQRMQADINETLTLLAGVVSQLPAPARDLAGTLLSQRTRVGDLLVERMPKDIAGLKTRYHGDYHLGQVLLAQNDFVIIDFEGEPARSFSERRQKHTPLRDVAGMLRSFNYAAYTALTHVVLEPPLAYGDQGSLMREWEAIASSAFLSAYAQATAEAGLWASWDQAQSWLQLLTLEKALYELRYEINNRPTWIHVPLRGLLEWINAA
ncbi:MAG: maltose alpha-D-glucosyltransferase [Acidiferrobacter sp.]